MSVTQIWNRREWSQTFCFFGDFTSAKLLAPRGIGPLRHSHRETIWLAERRGPAQHAESGWTQLSFQIYQTEATQREARRRLRLESEHESSTLREVLHLDDPLGDFQPKTKEAFDRFWLEESRKHETQRGHMVSAGFHCKPGATGTNSPVFVTEIWRHEKV